MQGITVIRAGALGDVVLALPAVAALRAAFPQSRLQAVGYPATWAVAGNLIDEVRSIDSAALSGLLTDVATAMLQQALGNSDLVVAWTVRDPTPVLHRIGVSHTLHIPPTPPPGVHAAHWLLQSTVDFLRNSCDVSLPASDLADWQLFYSAAERLHARAFLKESGFQGAVLIHPGAGGSWKRWPAERFASVGTALLRRGMPVALIAGLADGDTIAAVQRHTAHPFPVLPPMEARVLGAVLSYTPVYLGNDSGVTHLAGVSGVPTVALFGPTDPASWAPLGRSQVLRHCSAAGSPGTGIRVCFDPTCLHAITVDDVLEAIDRITVQNSVENCGQIR